MRKSFITLTAILLPLINLAQTNVYEIQEDGSEHSIIRNV